MAKLPPTTLVRRRASNLLLTSSPSALASTTRPLNQAPQTSFSACQTRSATYIHRPRRPYAFTQLIQLSDGSTYTVRTTSPAPVHRSDKDTRNNILWQPSEKTLKNVELDEAGKLAAFRQRFGRGFDLSAGASDEAGVAEGGDKAAEASQGGDGAGAMDLGDLISGYAGPAEQYKEAKRPVPVKADQSKKGK